MEAPRGWKNLSQGQETVFVTTTVQGFVAAFAQPRVADVVMTGIFEVCIGYGALLHAFVLMPEHMHLARMPEGIDAPIRKRDQIQGRKPGAARADSFTLRRIEQKRTLKDRKMWQLSFRSVIIEGMGVSPED